MTYTQHIALVLGPALVAVTISETINLKIWDDVHPALVYLNGLFFLVGGLVIVTTHNRWQFGWELVVTMSGWLLVLAGAYRMFFPTGPQLDPGPGTYAFIAVLFVLGLVLSAIGFIRL